MPIGENVLLVVLYNLVRQGGTRVHTVRDVIGSFKVVFSSVLQNTTRLGVVQVVEPFDKAGSGVFCSKIQQCRISQHFFSVAGHIFSISDKV